MIYTPFFDKILVKDYERPDSWTDELILTLKFLELNKEQYCTFYNMLKEKEFADNYIDDNYKRVKPYVIHTETAKQFPIIKELRDIFLDGFISLAKENNVNENQIRDIYKKDSGNFAVLRSGSRVGIHLHRSIAFAIFYLSDVDNENDGGELILHNPSYHRQNYFSSSKEVKIKTKKNRLVIGPSNIRHEVTHYTGTKDRMCGVIDLGVVL